MALTSGTSAAGAELPGIEVENLTSIFGNTVVLYRLGLQVPAGEVTVLMGPSGVGKSTLVKHILGLLEPAGGTVRIGDRDVWSSSHRQQRAVPTGVSAMLGGSSLFNTSVFGSLSVLGNLTATLKALGVPQHEHRERAVARLRELKILDVANRLPGQLPGHAVKRLALARALVADAPVAVLDEIDVGLDGEHSIAAIEAIRGLRRRTGCTLLLTTHNLELARSLGDHLAILVNGRIVAYGPPAQLLDGVESSEEFDRRFEFSDYLGPARLRDAWAAADRKQPKPPKNARLTTYSHLVWITVIAALTLLILVIGLKIYSGQTF
jgi:phospholipid/cholesterol/gamma-HCH transport system ATP-binding protein